MTSHQQDSTPMTQSIVLVLHNVVTLVYRSDPDYAANVVSNGTFSKIFCPGIRLGWIEAPYKILKLIADRYVCSYHRAIL